MYFFHIHYYFIFFSLYHFWICILDIYIYIFLNFTMQLLTGINNFLKRKFQRVIANHILYTPSSYNYVTNQTSGNLQKKHIIHHRIIWQDNLQAFASLILQEDMAVTPFNSFHVLPFSKINKSLLKRQTKCVSKTLLPV